MDMKYAPDIMRLNQGCKIISSLLLFNRQIRKSEIEALWWFQTKEEQELAIEFVQSLDVSVKTELVSREPLMEWDDIYTLDSPLGIKKQSKATMSDKIIPYVKEKVDGNMG